jgi:hypothetical protein
MINIIPFDEYLVEATSSVTDFLKSNYNKIFQEPNQSLNNLFVDFTKKIDKEKNTANLYQRFLKSNQITMQREINNADSIDAINKLLSDDIKYFYFSLKPIVNKLQNNEFTMEKIFERSRDKRLQMLMSYPEDQFSNAVQQYVNDGAIPWIKKDAKLDQTDQEKQQTQEPKQPTTTTEKIRYNIERILEQADPAADLLAYKKSALNWINLSLFDLIKPKMQLLNQLGATTSTPVDILAKQMKGSPNENAKKMILNKIVGMNKEELQNLANILGMKKEDLKL